MDLDVLSCWGMTENAGVTLTRKSDSQEKVFSTDGRALPGDEVRIVDEAKRPLPADTVGHLQARGITQFVGYLKKPQLNATDAEGWFDTGDLARIDKDGYIRIVGRTKDVIIRGGENIPVAEVENLISRHPKVAECAIVAMPDERLGERACAFVLTKESAPLTLGELTQFLGAQGMAKHTGPSASNSSPTCRARRRARSRSSSCATWPRPSRADAAQTPVEKSGDPSEF